MNISQEPGIDGCSCSNGLATVETRYEETFTDLHELCVKTNYDFRRPNTRVGRQVLYQCEYVCMSPLFPKIVDDNRSFVCR